MNEIQLNGIATLQTMVSYLETNKEVWVSTPIVATYISHLNEVVNSLNESSSEEEDTSKPLGSTLHQLRITIAEKMDIMDDILEAYAEDTNNSKLLSEAENSKSDYLRLTNDGFERKVSSVLRLLEANFEELKPYGIAQTDLAEAHSLFAEYQKKRTESPNKSVHPVPLEQSEQLIEEGIEISKKLNSVMVRFRNSNPSFYHGFTRISSFEEIKNNG